MGVLGGFSSSAWDRREGKLSLARVQKGTQTPWMITEDPGRAVYPTSGEG